MTFDEVLARVLELLQRETRISYRALKRRFDLDDAYLEDLKAGRIDEPGEVDAVHRRVMEITGDPLPYGIAPNRKVLEGLLGHAVTQGIIVNRVQPEDLFAASTRALVG